MNVIFSVWSGGLQIQNPTSLVAIPDRTYDRKNKGSRAKHAKSTAYTPENLHGDPKWWALEKVTALKNGNCWYLCWISGGVDPPKNPNPNMF